MANKTSNSGARIVDLGGVLQAAAQNRDNRKGASRLCNLKVCSEAIRKLSLLGRQNSEECKVWASFEVLEAARPCVKL